VPSSDTITWNSINHNAAQRRRQAKRKAKTQPLPPEATFDWATLPAPNYAQTVQVGTKLSVYWPKDDQYYPGTVTSINRRGFFKVTYDDGQEETLDLNKEVYRVSASPPPTPTSPPNSALRRSTRGVKVLRFDPAVHRPIPNTDSPYRALVASNLKHGQVTKGPDAADWKLATAREIGRCAQGMPGLVEGTDTFFFIRHTDKPPDRKVSYNTFVCDYKEHKAERHRVRTTFGNTASDYDGPVSSPTADITTVKIHLNSVLSTPGAKFCVLDVKNFFLNTPLTRYEYMWIPIKSIPDNVIEHYNLLPLVHNGYVMVEIRKGLYGLPQAALLAYELLVARLALHGYHPAPNTLGLFPHETRPISFTLWVDDFGIKYTNKHDLDHLIEALNEHYETVVDMTGSHYLGFTLKWDYRPRTLIVSMPGCIRRALERFGHPPPSTPQHSPHHYTSPQYGSGAQQTDEPDTSPLLGPTDIKHLQQVIGVLLYYARMLDNTLLTTLNTLGAQQSKGTQATMDALVIALNYAATHPEAEVKFTASDMILHISSDASYLSASEGRSRLGGYFFLSNIPKTVPPLPDDPPAKPNGPILVNSSIIKSVVSSAAEAELAALFYNAKDGCSLRTTLADMGHPQPPTLIQADNACAVGIANDTVKQKRSKAIDMRYYWVRDRVRQGQFIIYWQRGSDNLADYFTKHHPPSHHRRMRSRYLHTHNEQKATQVPTSALIQTNYPKPETVRGCIDIQNITSYHSPDSGRTDT
jgi:hypothetical protein